MVKKRNRGKWEEFKKARRGRKNYLGKKRKNVRNEQEGVTKICEEKEDRGGK